MLRMLYKNHRGETAMRRIMPISIRYGATKWHPEDQWLLKAYDFDKKEPREFSLKDCDFRTGQAGVLPK